MNRRITALVSRRAFPSNTFRPLKCILCTIQVAYSLSLNDPLRHQAANLTLIAVGLLVLCTFERPPVAPNPCDLLTAVSFFPPVTLPSAVLEKPAETKYPTDVRSSLFVQTFVACVASAVDPVLLVRLLAHRLVTTPLYPRNSSSITSMSGQDQFPPRTTRSRASSTDTNASTRRKRVSSAGSTATTTA